MLARLTPCCAALLLLLAGCASDDAPPPAEPEPGVALPALETRADSVAMRVYDALGGPEAWNAVGTLRFDFAFAQDTTRRHLASHLWDRTDGDYRVEWRRSADSAYVVLFNVDTREGQAYLNGAALDSAANAQALDQAYRRYINDTYWLLAPIKLLDPGVNRAYEADSSDADTDVLRITFDGVGLTPGDTYWHYVDAETGRPQQWAFVLQGNPDAAPSFFEWTDYESFETPAGPVQVATRKQGDGRALLTDRVAIEASADSTLFTDPQPRLMD